MAAEPGEGSRAPAEKLNSILARAKESEKEPRAEERSNDTSGVFPSSDRCSARGLWGEDECKCRNDIERRKKNAERLRGLTRKMTAKY